MVYKDGESWDIIPSREWLARRNLKFVVDKHGHWHLEPLVPANPFNPNSGKKIDRPPFRPLPLDEDTGLSPEDGIPTKFKLDPEVRKRAKKH